MNTKNKSILQHLGFWLVFWLVQSLLFSGAQHLDFYLAKNLVIVSLQAIVVYINWHLLFPLISTRRYIVYSVLGISLVYLVYSIAYTLIDATLSAFFPNVVQLDPYKFKWITSFWSILSGSAPYSIALLACTIFCLIRLNNSLKNKPEANDSLEEEVDKATEEKTLMLKEGKVIHKLQIDDILFVQGMKEYVSWHTKDKKLITLHSLASLEDQLGDKGFLRTHKSFIVNKNCVNAIRYDCLEIPGNKIPIGRSYRSKVQDCFQSEI